MRVRGFLGAIGLLACANTVAAEFEFVVIGDTRPRFESESFLPFESLIRKINACHPALVINLGDLIYGYGPLSRERQWEKYQAAAANVHGPYYQVPGNHDTHSKAARSDYGKRFGSFYQSFDYGGCHFVLLDNNESQHWGYLGPDQLNWLKQDLKQTRAGAVFVFLHFPVWEPERITPQYYDFWRETLHPLFLQSGVRAVFGGHYHTYGPSREFDGIRYFITGGGGAELRPEYKKAGGEFHFLKVKVNPASEQFDVRVVTEHGELTDPEADIMGGLQFASGHVSRIGIKPLGCDPGTGVTFSVSVQNPYPQTMTGEAAWLMDASVCTVAPDRVKIEIPPVGKREFSFNLKALKPAATLQSLPQLEFNVAAGGRRHRFHREVRLVQEAPTPFRPTAPALDGALRDWSEVPAVKFQDAGGAKAELRSCWDGQALYLALCVPAFESAEAKEIGFSDEVQIGFSRCSSETDFGADMLRVGLDSDSTLKDRTPGHRMPDAVAGMKMASRTRDGQTCYEIAIPLRQLRALNFGAPGSRLMLDLSFLQPEEDLRVIGKEPEVNSFEYRVRYGSDSLVPVHFVELKLQRGGSGGFL